MASSRARSIETQKETDLAEDSGLLPDDSFLNVFQHRDPYNTKPVCQTFLGLLNAIDRGNDQLKIPRYNGGLFQPNATIDALEAAWRLIMRAMLPLVLL